MVAKDESVTRVTLAEGVMSANPEMSHREATEVVDAVLGTIQETLARGEDVMISGFGKFVVQEKKERVGRNPQTGASVVIPARKTLKFRASQNFKDLVNKRGR